MPGVVGTAIQPGFDGCLSSFVLRSRPPERVTVVPDPGLLYTPKPNWGLLATITPR